MFPDFPRWPKPRLFAPTNKICMGYTGYFFKNIAVVDLAFGPQFFPGSEEIREARFQHNVYDALMGIVIAAIQYGKEKKTT